VCGCPPRLVAQTGHNYNVDGIILRCDLFSERAMSIEIRSTYTPYAEYSTVHDVLRTRSGAPVTAPDSSYLEDRAPSAEWCVRAYTLSNAELLAEVEAKLTTTECPETQVSVVLLRSM